MYSFQGKTAWITGSSLGIGRAAALAFAQHGANVIVHGNSNPAKAQEVADEIQAMGGQAMVVVGDVSDRSQVERMVEEINSRFDCIDILVNNAGTLVKRAQLHEMDEELWDSIIDINLKSVYLVTKAALPLLRKSPKARVINVTSIAARNGGGFGSFAYAAAKGGVSTMTRGWAKEFIPYGITVNAISPGTISTAFHDRFSTEEMRKRTVTTIPMGREGTPEETVGAALFLASDYADFITGEIIEVNGGQLMD